MSDRGCEPLRHPRRNQAPGALLRNGAVARRQQCRQQPGQLPDIGFETLDIMAGAGTHWLAVDTFVSGGRPLAGGYRLTLVRVDGGI